MKKNNRKELSLSMTTVRSLVRGLETVTGGLYQVSAACGSKYECYTKPAGGCP